MDALERTPDSSAKAYDFYYDANIPEVKKVISALRTLIDRLSSLIR